MLAAEELKRLQEEAAAVRKKRSRWPPEREPGIWTGFRDYRCDVVLYSRHMKYTAESFLVREDRLILAKAIVVWLYMQH